MPLVVIGGEYDRFSEMPNELPFVTNSNRQTVYAVTKELIELGINSIGFFLRARLRFYEECALKGYEKAMNEAGLKIQKINADSNITSIHHFRDLIASGQAPQVLYCNAWLLPFISQEIGAKGAPHIVVSDTSYFAHLHSLDISSIQSAEREIGKSAVELIQNVFVERRVVIPGKLSIGAKLGAITVK